MRKDKPSSCLYIILVFFTFEWLVSINASFAGIHTVPIIIPAQMIRSAQYHPVGMYRVFKSLPDGTAEPIPFQIDEKDRYGDYILGEGKLPNTKFSNGIFDFRDELTIMGNDVGIIKIPTKWPFKQPSVLYEVIFKDKHGTDKGAIYIGAYFNKPPEPSDRNYVNFLLNNAEIVTSRYRYRFDHKNYLVVRGVDINQKGGKTHPLIDSSTLFLRADLKYFLTLDINQESITSELEAYKRGPIRCIARVNFNYKILKLNFDMGMYTEVSFFSNSVVLPALIDNPLDGKKILNKGSLFYYGFAFMDNPWTLRIDTNMPEFQESTILDFLKGKRKAENNYWFTAMSRDYMIYVEMKPSAQMKLSGNVPMFYRENTPASDLRKRSSGASVLGDSPVNLAIAVDLTAFNEGMHNVAIKLFVENRESKEILEEYKDSDSWSYSAKRLSSSDFKEKNKTNPKKELEKSK